MVFERWGGLPHELYPEFPGKSRLSGTPRGDPVEIPLAAERPLAGLRAMG